MAVRFLLGAAQTHERKSCATQSALQPPCNARTGNGATAMSDDFDDVETDPEVLNPNIRQELRKAKEAKAELEDAKRELAAMKSEVAFTKAGIPEEGPGALLRKAFAGETDPDAIRKAAEEYGVFQPTAPPANNEPDYSGELDALARAQGATSGSGVGSGMSTGDKFQSALSAATNQEEMMAVIREFGQAGLGFTAGNN